MRSGPAWRRLLPLGVVVAVTATMTGPGAYGSEDIAVELKALARTVQEVDLRWQPPGPAEGCGTTVWRDGATIAVLCGSVRTFVDRAVAPGTRYQYRIVTGGPGRGPLLSNVEELTTPALPETVDITPPSSPGDLQAVADDRGVLLSWQAASDDTDISVYEIRRDGLVVAVVDSATLDYLDPPVPPGVDATYSITAEDVLGQTSRPVQITVTGPEIAP